MPSRSGSVAIQIDRDRTKEVCATRRHQFLMDLPFDQTRYGLAPLCTGEPGDTIAAIGSPQCGNGKGLSGISERPVFGDDRTNGLAILKQAQTAGEICNFRGHWLAVTQLEPTGKRGSLT